MSSDGSAVYVAARAATKLTVVDTVTGKIKRTVPVTAGSTSVAVTGQSFGRVIGSLLVATGLLAIWFPWLLPGLHASVMPAT